MITEKKLITLGWALYALVWILLSVNIANDLRNHGWVSPLSILALVILGGGHLVRWYRGQPILTLEGWQTRFTLTVIGVLAVIAAVMTYNILAIIR